VGYLVLTVVVAVVGNNLFHHTVLVADIAANIAAVGTALLGHHPTLVVRSAVVEAAKVALSKALTKLRVSGVVQEVLMSSIMRELAEEVEGMCRTSLDLILLRV
jgi:hypothetical protein